LKNVYTTLRSVSPSVYGLEVHLIFIINSEEKL